MPDNISNMRELLATITELYKEISCLLNIVGKFYLKFQLIFRVLFVNILLSDLFSLPQLKCDTQQIGCESMCINRFAPITFIKLWQLELWYILFVSGLFVIFAYGNKKVHQQFAPESRVFKMARMHQKPGKYRGNAGSGPDFYYSRIITFGYVLMLVLRFSGELWFIYIERQLAIHQSGKSTISSNVFEMFNLEEKFSCRTNSAEPLNFGTKVFSEIFHINEPLHACSQQVFEIPCWIPYSRMKSKGLYFMHLVLISGCFLTFVELMVSMVRICKKMNDREMKVKTAQGARHDVMEQDLPVLVPYLTDFKDCGTQINVISAPSTIV